MAFLIIINFTLKKLPHIDPENMDQLDALLPSLFHFFPFSLRNWSKFPR